MKSLVSNLFTRDFIVMDALLVENQYRSRTVINLHSADCKHSKIGSLEAGALQYLMAFTQKLSHPKSQNCCC